MKKLGGQNKTTGSTGSENGAARPLAETADNSRLGSPETYFGAARNELLANGVAGLEGSQALKEPEKEKIELNQLYLAGEWNFSAEFAQNTGEGARIIFKYDAKKVFFVAAADKPVMIKVLRDGVPVGGEKGEDLEDAFGESVAVVQEPRLYRLIAEKDYGEHTIEIIATQPGLKAYTFTFG